MPLTEKPLTAVRVDYTCDRCGAGQMRPTGMTLTSDPPQYPHRCTACDAHDNYRVTYPHISYAEKDTP